MPPPPRRVCTTELGRAAVLAPEFERRDYVLVGLSVDSLASHVRWHDDILAVTGQSVGFPLIADPERRVATLYGMLHPNASDTATVRSVFVIGPDDRVKLTRTYPASTGRNFDELLRVLDSLQLTARHAVATPADWRFGADVIIAPATATPTPRRASPAASSPARPISA